MGMFDSVIIKCNCGEDVEFQSKAGECILATYAPDGIPLDIARDLDGTTEVCPQCGKEHTFHAEDCVYIYNIPDDANIDADLLERILHVTMEWAVGDKPDLDEETGFQFADELLVEIKSVLNR